MVLLILNQFYHPISEQIQVIIFFLGLLIVGIPHGGADRLVSLANAMNSDYKFSKSRFNIIYFGNIISLSIILYLFPLSGITLFLFLAAYHFGETDLQDLCDQSAGGKFLKFTYGMLVLGIILLSDSSGLQSTLRSLDTGATYTSVIYRVGHYHMEILFGLIALFYTTGLVYYLLNRHLLKKSWSKFFQLHVLFIILYKLPSLLSFTFYFIIWHSVLSLKNIIVYLRYDKPFHLNFILREMIKNSLIAIAGILFFGLIAFRFFKNNDDLVTYSVLGLAVLTVPHMKVMHYMYKHIDNLNKANPIIKS